MSAVTIEDEQQANGQEEATVTMQEVYDQLQSDARQAQVLATRAGAAKLERCSYALASHSQPVFWCRTCHADKQVGVCFGCSMNCHLDHQVEELFEKRGFTCDCGNEKAGGRCMLQPEKAPENASNVYSHNFKGEYCYCNGTYNADSDVMINCILCQDWMHAETTDKPNGCIDAKLPEVEGHADFVCRGCIANPKYSILLPYFDLATSAAEEGPAAGSSTNTPSMSRSVSVAGSATKAEESKEEPSSSAAPSAASIAPISTSASIPAESKEAEPALDTDVSMQTPSRKRKIEETLPNFDSATAAASSSPAVAAPSTSSPAEAAAPIVCSRPSASFASSSTAPSSSSSSSFVQDRFIPNTWNQYLCVCPACTAEYAERGLSWLVDGEETEHGDGQGQANLLGAMTDADQAVPLEGAFDSEVITANLIGNMPRATAIDVLTPFQLYQASIKRQLEEFAVSHPSGVVTKEIIHHITENAKRESVEGARELKRQRMNGEESLPE